MTNIDLNSFLLAARTGNITVLKNGLEQGIDIHLCNDLALRYAKQNNQTEAVKFLIANGANALILDDVDLRLYSSIGDTEKVMQLLIKGNCSQEAMTYAIYNGILYNHEEIVGILKDYVSPLANDGAILKVLSLCQNPKIIALFEEFLS